jgi:hypothetical protein
MVPLSGHGRRPGPAGARPLPPRSGACRRRAVGAARPRRRGRGARRGVSGCVWGTRRSQKVTLLVALNFCAPLRHAMADACTDPCSCTLLRSHPAACDTRPRALYRPWRTQHRSHDKRLSVRRPAPGHRRRGRDCRHALPSPHYVVARRRRRRFLMSAAPPHPATIVASAGQRWRRRQRCRRAARARAARCPSRNRSRAIG